MQENQTNKQRLERISEILEMMRDKLVEELNRKMFSEYSKITIKIIPIMIYVFGFLVVFPRYFLALLCPNWAAF